MDQKIRVTIHKEKAVTIMAYLNDFRGTMQEWKNAVYEMFRYNVAWSFAYSIDVRETREDVRFVTVIRPAYRAHALNVMKDLGFKPVISDVEVGVIECTEFPDDWMLEHITEE